MVDQAVLAYFSPPTHRARAPPPQSIQVAAYEIRVARTWLAFPRTKEINAIFLTPLHGRFLNATHKVSTTSTLGRYMGIIFRPFIDGHQGTYVVGLLWALPGGQGIEENSFRSSPLAALVTAKHRGMKPRTTTWKTARTMPSGTQRMEQAGVPNAASSRL